MEHCAVGPVAARRVRGLQAITGEGAGGCRAHARSSYCVHSWTIDTKAPPRFAGWERKIWRIPNNAIRLVLVPLRNRCGHRCVSPPIVFHYLKNLAMV